MQTTTRVQRGRAVLEMVARAYISLLHVKPFHISRLLCLFIYFKAFTCCITGEEDEAGSLDCQTEVSAQQ